MLESTLVAHFRFIIGSLIAVSLFPFVSHGTSGEMHNVRVASCGRVKCVTIEAPTAQTSFVLGIVDFQNTKLKIHTHNGRLSSYSAPEIFIDADKIILRKVAEFRGRDAVYDLKSEQLTSF